MLVCELLRGQNFFMSVQSLWPFVAMALCGYGLLWLWPFVAMGLCSYGPLSLSVQKGTIVLPPCARHL